MLDRWREVPPTAGLPMQWGDFAPGFSTIPLETTLSSLLEVPSVTVECSGTAALVIALMTLKRNSPRRNVVIPAYTCPLVALAVLHCELTPVLCDLAPDSFELDADALANACDRDTLALIVTHLGGKVANLDVALLAARRCGAFLIEDAAQSLGASWRGRMAGTIGDIGFFSLAAGKGLTLYEGGILVARDPAMRKAIQETRGSIVPFRWGWELRRSLELIGYAIAYRPRLLRFAYGGPLRRELRKGRLTAAVGDEFTSSIPIHRVGNFRRRAGAHAATRLRAFLDALSIQGARRKTALDSIIGIRVISDSEETRGTWPFFMVVMPSARASEQALEQLWTAGLGVTRLFIHALPDYAYLRGRIGARDVSHARDFASRMLTISNSPWLRDSEFDRICSVLRSTVGAVN